MNRERILKDLAMVERDLARVADSLRGQERVVAELMGMGRSALANEAKEVLAKFQGLDKADRERKDRLLRELGEIDMRDSISSH